MNLPHDKELAVVVVHGWSLGVGGLELPGPNFLEAIAKRARDTGRADVGVLHWEDDAGFLPWQSGVFNKVGLNTSALGPRMGHAVRIGNCLANALVGYERVHLIGHSLGSWLIDAAADELPATTQVHITFLDAYAPSSEEGAALGDSADFAEHFVSRPPHALLPHSDWQLRSPRNFDVTHPDAERLGQFVGEKRALRDRLCSFVLLRSAFCDGVNTVYVSAALVAAVHEHGGPIQWYAESTTPGMAQSWVMGGAPQPLRGGLVSVPANRSVHAGEFKVSTAELPISAQVGDISQSATGIRLRTQSPASVVIEVPQAARVAVEFVATTQGPGTAFVEFQLGDGEVTRAEFGSEGCDCLAHIFAGEGRSATRLRVVLDTNSIAASALLPSIIIVDGEPESEPPLPPNTGNAESVQSATPWSLPLGFGGVLVVAAVLAVWYGRRTRH